MLVGRGCGACSRGPLSSTCQGGNTLKHRGLLLW